MSLLKSYKPGMAKTSRTITNVTGVFFILWGGLALSQSLGRIQALSKSLNQFQGASFEERWRVDILVMETNLSPALLIAVAVVLAALLWWQRFLNSEKWAEMLIDMEGEMRKVSWPTLSDAWQSTLVVTACTVILVSLIFLYDTIIHAVLALFTSA